MGSHVCPGNTHDEAQIGTQPIIGAEHGSTQRIAAQRAMPAFEPSDCRAAETPWSGHCQCPDDAGVRSFGRGQTTGHGFRLCVVSAAVSLLEGIDGRQYKGRTETARQPCKRPRPEARLEFWEMLTDRLDLALPELCMRFLDCPETGI